MITATVKLLESKETSMYLIPQKDGTVAVNQNNNYFMIIGIVEVIYEGQTQHGKFEAGPFLRKN